MNLAKKTRKELQLTVNRMAAICGVHRQTWVKWERGESPPSAAATQLMRVLCWVRIYSSLDDLIVSKDECVYPFEDTKTSGC